ncbi:MAG TPA: HD domain-containing phosphohydrolase [Candidatus Dormibacteraeota bacterium]
MEHVRFSSRRRPRVLVVDDRRLNIEVTMEYLAELDCEVFSATNGYDALTIVAEHSLDLVLLDIMMPGLDGFEVCRRIKAAEPTRLLPVVLVTALNQAGDRARGLDMGADDFIVKPVDRHELLARVRSLLRLKELYDRLEDSERVIFALARAVEAKDSYTESHTERVGRTALALAAAAGIAGAELEDVYRGGVIHDIGKIGVPDHILLKPGPLDVEEVEQMRLHTVIGAQILAPLLSASTLVPIVRHHHERMDGLGYPDGLVADEIPLAARVVAVCDAFDAMVSTRPYRAGLSPHEARAILLDGAGTQWDAELVRLFLERVEPNQAAKVAS